MSCWPPAQTFKGRWSRWIPILVTHGTAIPIPTASGSASTGDIPDPAGIAARSRADDRHSSFFAAGDFHGYLIIYNIFQISVAGDIRFYGLLKTIGTTPRQLKRIIRQQALLLCLIGIPAGLLLGYGIGAVLMPVVLHSIQLNTGITTISTSPVTLVLCCSPC